MQDCSNHLYQADSYLIESVKYVFRFDLEHLEVSPYSSIAFELSHVRQYLLRLTPMLPIIALANNIHRFACLLQLSSVK